MRFPMLALAGAIWIVTGSANAQSVAELRAQYQQTQSMLNQAEAMGMDPSLVSSLRESLEGLRQTIDEMEREQSSAYSSEQAAEPESAVQQAEPNLASGVCSAFGFDEANYRQRALAAGDDQQIRSMCGQAYEYYTMYKRALSQRHPEAWKTYDAHSKTALVLNNFYGETQTLPNEGIREDTRTASDDAADAARRSASTTASAPPKPPPAPPCKGCVTPQ